MNDRAQYWLNSGAWLLIGLVLASIYWRLYIHRLLVNQGKVTREQPLSLFMAFLVGMMTTIGLLFSWSGRLALNDYVHCQSAINQKNVETINDRTSSAVGQLYAENTFYEALLKIFSAAPSGDNRQKVIQSIYAQIDQNNGRITALLNSPLQPVTDCKPPKAGVGG